MDAKTQGVKLFTTTLNLELYTFGFPWPEFNIIFEIFSAIAIMGVAADRARVDGGLYNYDTFLNETEIIYSNLDRVHLDFFIEMKRVDFDLEKIEDTVLANTVAVLRFTCSKDPLDYFGYGMYISSLISILLKVGKKYFHFP